ncbi:M15 family metallopeptidase [Actinomadura craniellae]|nr:M15 family metallopeptidase [Actinomadura craniellae]
MRPALLTGRRRYWFLLVTLVCAALVPLLIAMGGTTAPHSPPGGDGPIPPGRNITPFDTGYAAVGKLDARLLKALQAAAEDARDDGIAFHVTSGWRSEEHQRRLLDEAVRTYGSRAEARRFVSTPEESAHVTGEAVDVGPTAAAYWLIQHGADHGLCQVYANEVWHFELRTHPGGTCPPLLPDAAG